MALFFRHVLVWLLAGVYVVPVVARAQTASMLVETNVDSAVVRVDDRVRAITDSTGAAFVDSLTVGTHVVVARKTGHESDSATVELDADLTGSVSLRLARVQREAAAPGTTSAAPRPQSSAGGLLVETTPSDAVLFVDGTRRGRTGADGRAYVPRVEPGTHSLSIRKDGFETQSQTVTIEDDGLDRTVEVTLQPVNRSSASSSVPSPRRAPQAEASGAGGYGLWSLIAAGLAGLALGGLGGWFVRRQQVAELKDDRDYWESRFRDEQGRAYRSAVGVRPGPSAPDDGDDAGDAPPDPADATDDPSPS